MPHHQPQRKPRSHHLLAKSWRLCSGTPVEWNIIIIFLRVTQWQEITTLIIWRAYGKISRKKEEDCSPEECSSIKTMLQNMATIRDCGTSLTLFTDLAHLTLVCFLRWKKSLADQHFANDKITSFRPWRIPEIPIWEILFKGDKVTSASMGKVCYVSGR